MAKFIEYNPSFEGKWLKVSVRDGCPGWDNSTIVDEWCHENLTSRWSCNFLWKQTDYYFKNINDATYFKMTWG